MDGKDVRLPLPAVAPVRPAHQEELEYLVGFFDGDGCVSLNKATGHVQLVISQNVDSAEVLLHFRSLLGGSVSRHSAGTGSKKATVKWHVHGSKMIATAETLSSVPSMKQAQLLMAKQGYIAVKDRVRVAECLQVLKQRHHVPDQWRECTWPYFASFFDAEGTIVVSSTHVGLRLEVGQVNPCVLDHILYFLHEGKLKGWALHHWDSHSALVCQKLPDIKQTLELLLASGLLVKRKQAELALSLTAENHLQISRRHFLAQWPSGPL